MFLIDKYRPMSIHQYLFNQEIMLKLMYLAQHENIPHVIIVGPQSSGKSMMLHHLLVQIHGIGVLKTKKMKFKINGSNSKKDIELDASDFHIVIEPTNTNHDKHLLSGVIKQYAMEKPITAIKRKKHYKTIIINHLEKLSDHSQATLRTILEEYSSICRFIMICDNITVIMEALRSRCQIIRVPHPTNDIIHRVITYISRMEGMMLTEKESQKIIQDSNYNLKNAIWLLDKKRFGIVAINSTDEVYATISQLVIDSLKVDNLVPLRLVNRLLVYRVLVNNINGSEIIRSIMNLLMNRIDDDEICFKMLESASKAELNLNEGRREAMHIEMFTDCIMFELLQKGVDNVKIIGKPAKYCFDIITDPDQLDAATNDALNHLKKTLVKGKSKEQSKD